jgi:hypothetical protein
LQPQHPPANAKRTQLNRKPKERISLEGRYAPARMKGKIQVYQIFKWLTFLCDAIFVELLDKKPHESVRPPPRLCYFKSDLFIDSQSVSWVLRRTREWHKLCLLHALLGEISKQIMPES